MTERPILPGQRTPLTGEDLRLPKPPGVIRQFWARHPWWTDSLVTACYFVPSFLTVLSLTLFQPERYPGWIVAMGMLAIVLTGAALLFRRYRPWTVLAVTWLGTLATLPFEGRIDTIAIPLALYALAVYRSVRAAWVGLGCSIIVGTAAAFLSETLHRSDLGIAPFGATPPAASSQFAVFMLLATLIGINIGNRRRYLAALVDRAGQLARERDQQAQLAAAAERSRIAREMHDIVSHSLTVMVTLAEGSAATTAGSPERAAETMRRVAETGRRALTDMRRMLGVLHEGAGDAQASTVSLEPQPGSAEIAPLIDTLRAAGLLVHYTSSGAFPEDPGEQLTVYRIVQESLTNALRHAREATEVTVDVRYEEEITTMTVTDNGRGVPASNDHPSGHGLVGMKERVALYGGTLETGPGPHGGWRVRATLRHEPTPGHEPEASR